MSQLTIDLPTHVTPDEARLLGIKLYEDQRIPLGKAAERVTLHSYPDSSGADRAP